MSENYTPNIGHLITEDNARRDCLHFAVAPLTAGEFLEPGDHFILNEEGEAVATLSVNPYAIGVVDPFLTTDVNKGQRFWGMLKPNTITGLRHVWSHPAFRPRLPGAAKDGQL